MLDFDASEVICFPLVPSNNTKLEEITVRRSEVIAAYRVKDAPDQCVLQIRDSQLIAIAKPYNEVVRDIFS